MPILALEHFSARKGMVLDLLWGESGEVLSTGCTFVGGCTWVALSVQR